ncbi:MAG: NADAR family protein [Pseudomonadaceae bacterium]|nr:NADAR family protein [Pseudomonadaceae bacterium]
MQVVDDRPINFIEHIWCYLSPFSAHQIDIWGESFPTVEHAYHWKRYLPGQARTKIMQTKSPLECLHVSHQLKKDPALLDPAFDKDAVMEELFRAKLDQHPHIADVLKLTGERVLLKEISTDPYWGTGADGKGLNKMGDLWMKLRKELTVAS